MNSFWAKASFTGNARVEQVTVSVDLDTSRLQDVKLELISANGTASTLLVYPQPQDTNGAVALLPTHLSYTLDTVRSWGESLTGEWALKLSNKASGATVSLDNWSIKAYTATAVNTSAQIFTNEFSTFKGLQAGRTTLITANGTEINASAVTAASTLDLSGAVPSHIRGGCSGSAGSAVFYQSYHR